MGIKPHKPTSAGQRFRQTSDFKEVTKSKSAPEKSLTKGKTVTAGRNNHGHVTSRFRGQGHKRALRQIDFKRDKIGVQGKVEAIEYDPNRSAHIALINYTDGEKRYIVSPKDLKVGDPIVSSAHADIKPGNNMKLKYVPLGTVVHNIELYPGKGGQIVRAAGGGAQLLAKEAGYATLRLPSGEVRKIQLECRSTIGEVGNQDFVNISGGKAGRNRWLGFRGHVRGVAMNPVDHPMGGGEGRTCGGRQPCTPNGLQTKGRRTRNNKKSDRYIVTRRYQR
jgi:large subunit ribosomal protein L2